MKSFLSNIVPYHFNELILNGLSLDMLYCLKMVENDIDVEYFFKDSSFGQGIIQTLERKGYMKEGSLTTEGRALILYMESPPTSHLKLKKKIRIAEEDFEKFWNAYPATDNIIKDGKIIFKGTRALRKGKKDELKVKLSKILDEKIYSLDDIIKAVTFETQQKINESIKTKQNKLSYMQNVETYINQRSFEAFVEVSKLSTELKEEKTRTFITEI